MLTEPTRFDGVARGPPRGPARGDLPVLRKDFLVHPAQLIEARAAGADAVLLIAAALSELELKAMLGASRTTSGSGALVETHTEEDLGRRSRPTRRSWA